MPQVVITAPKLLSPEEFKLIGGSDLHATLIKNRMCLNVGTSDAPAQAILKEVFRWLAENCSTTYYILDKTPSSYQIIVYIEGDADVVAFQLMFNGMDIEEEHPPVRAPKPPPPPKPARDTTLEEILEAMKRQKDRNRPSRPYRRYDDYDYSRDVWEDYPSILPRARYTSSSSIESAENKEELDKIAKAIGLKYK